MPDLGERRTNSGIDRFLLHFYHFMRNSACRRSFSCASRRQYDQQSKFPTVFACPIAQMGHDVPLGKCSLGIVGKGGKSQFASRPGVDWLWPPQQVSDLAPRLRIEIAPTGTSR
jgi:hypothetical protein